MDKLPRLMASDPEFIQPQRLADEQGQLTGELALTALERLCKILCDDDGSVIYSLAFDRDELGFISITGEFSSELTLTCQRCLQPMEIRLHNEISVGIVASKAEVDRLPESYEPLILTDGRLSLPMFIEDEVLLCLPIAPMHNTEECPAAGLVGDQAMDRHHPFAVLKDLNLKKSKS